MITWCKMGEHVMSNKHSPRTVLTTNRLASLEKMTGPFVLFAKVDVYLTT